MAINRADTYQVNLPEQQLMQRMAQGQRQAANPQGPSFDKMDEYFGVPKPLEGLQRTGDLALKSAEYFKKRNDLQAFARTQWLKNKIDVTAPDPSNQAAVIASEIYRMGLADIQNTGDALKTGQEMLTQALPYVYENRMNLPEQVGEVPFGEMNPQDFRRFDVRPDVKFAADQLGQEFDPSTYGTAVGRRNDFVQGLSTDQSTPESQQAFNLGSLITPQKQTFAPRDNGGAGGDSDPTLQFIKKYAYLAKGSPALYKPSGVFKEGTNSEYGISYEDVGTSIGTGTYKDAAGNIKQEPFIVSYYMFDPDTNEAFAVAQNPAMQPKPLKSDLLLSFMGDVADSNRGGLFTSKGLRDYLSSNAKTNKFKDYSADFFLEPSEISQADAFKTERKVSGQQKAVERATEEAALSSSGENQFIGGVVNPANWLTRNVVAEYVLPNGNSLVIKKNFTDDKSTIDNWKKVIPAEYITNDGVKIGSLTISKSAMEDGLTPDKLRQLREALGAKTIGSKVAKPSEIDPDI